MERVRKGLERPTQTLQVTGMADMLARIAESRSSPLIPFLNSDLELSSYRQATVTVRRAAYTDQQGVERIEAIDTEHEMSITLGKSAWWNVPATFPPR